MKRFANQRMTRFSRRRFLALASALPVLARQPASLPAADEEFLEDLSRRCFLFFWEQADAHSGFVLDRVRTDGNPTPGRSADIASIGTTGFALTALCIGFARRWTDPNEIRERVRATLRFLAYNQQHQLGWYYHFVNRKSGDRAWKCELSTIDSALLLAGILTAQQCFTDDYEIFQIAQSLYERVDFAWMLDESTNLLRMGWLPESGFLRAEWTDYRENPILNLLAIGSPTHPVPPRTWYAFERDPVQFGPYRFVGGGPMFTHQYPQAWLRLDGLRDGGPFGIDYFHNSRLATYAHRAYCLSLRSMFAAFSRNLWGVTPSDSEIGYLGWGNAFTRRDFDGTIVPCAAAGSLMFAPEICLPALRETRDQFGDYIFGRYGFADAFQPVSRWVNPDVVGIDVGITLLSAENLRSGRVWDWFMRAPGVQRAVNQIFHLSEAKFSL
jgi:hypothetical protein